MPGIKDTMEEQGFVRASEPACESGALIIALADEMHRQQVNYQQRLHVTAIDLDKCCTHTTYVQFSLLHIPAVVIYRNALSLEEYSHWYTPSHSMGGWEGKLARRAKNEDFIKTAHEIIAQTEDSTAPKKTPVPEKTTSESKTPPIKAGTQLKLF